MSHDPKEIADHLVQQHGENGAFQIAVENAIAMQNSGDNYALSIWRDVKRVLNSLREKPAA